METPYNNIISLGKLGLPPKAITAATNFPEPFVLHVLHAENLKHIGAHVSRSEAIGWTRDVLERTAKPDPSLPFPQVLDGRRAHGGGQQSWRTFVWRWRERYDEKDLSRAYVAITEFLAKYELDLSFYVVRKWWQAYDQDGNK